MTSSYIFQNKTASILLHLFKTIYHFNDDNECAAIFSAQHVKHPLKIKLAQILTQHTDPVAIATNAVLLEQDCAFILKETTLLPECA